MLNPFSHHRCPLPQINRHCRNLSYLTLQYQYHLNHQIFLMLRHLIPCKFIIYYSMTCPNINPNKNYNYSLLYTIFSLTYIFWGRLSLKSLKYIVRTYYPSLPYGYHAILRTIIPQISQLYSEDDYPSYLSTISWGRLSLPIMATMPFRGRLSLPLIHTY